MKKMTYTKAYQWAMDRSVEFRDHDMRVKSAMKNGGSTACLFFTCGTGESFYYGFDGVDLHCGKHTARRSSVLLQRGNVLVIV